MKNEDSQIKLSIITPYYKTLEQIFKLSSILLSQMTDNVEWIIIDDGCHENKLDRLKINNNVNIIHLPENSGSAGLPRNVGLDNSHGEYIVFIDSDDLVELDYIDTILNKIESDNFDYCYFGWKSHCFKIIITDEPPYWNMSIWNCIYKRDIIGDERFDPNLIIAEDFDFNKRVRRGKKSTIQKILYTYNDTPNSLMKRYKDIEKERRDKNGI